MKSLDLGTLFDTLAERGATTTVQLSRPFDIAPQEATSLGVGQLADLVHRAAGWLHAAGARPGDRVAIVKDNHWDSVLLGCAAMRIGAVPALLSDRLPAATLATLLDRLTPAVGLLSGRVLRAGLDAGVDLTPFATRTVYLPGPVPGPPVRHAVPLDELRGHADPGPHRRAADDPLVVNHTSGTTGVPKLVVHSTTTIIRRLAGFEAHRWPVLASRRDDTVAWAGEFCHGRAIPWTAGVFWLAPREVVILTDSDPLLAEPVLRAHPPTTLEASPACFVRWRSLTGGPDNPFRDVRLFVSTLDAVHPPTVRAFLTGSRRRRPVWVQGWGQTETGPLTFRFLTRRALAVPQGDRPTTRDLGHPVPTRTRLRVVDPLTLRPVPRGRPGLVMARTKALCLDYLAEHDRWADKECAGWWNTGDLGVLSATGALRLLDREVDAVPGLSCLELEDVIEERLPDVLECAVLGRLGDTPQPVLVTEGGQVDPGAWRRAVRGLPELAEPIVSAWDDVPRTPTGKIRRAELRERLAGGAPRLRG